MSDSPSSRPAAARKGGASRRTRVERSAGGVVMRRIENRIHILVIRDPYQNWGLPKGHLEPGESSADAALRETAEETGLDDLVLGPELETIDWYFRADDALVHKYCTFFLLGSREGSTEPETAEGITACDWVDLEEAEERITYDNARAVVTAARRGLDSGALSLPWGP